MTFPIPFWMGATLGWFPAEILARVFRMFPSPDKPTEKSLAWLSQLTEEELLDRWVFCRDELTETGQEATEAEVNRRGLSPAHQERHRGTWESRLWRDSEGKTRVCQACDRLAVCRKWSFRKVFGLIPLLPIRVSYCADHAV